jgi:tRNA A37 threonylcarbamoyltransferase TsaD
VTTFAKRFRSLIVCCQDAQLQKSDIDAIAYTSGPGLLGALIVGATIARSIAAGLGVPALGIHHMEGTSDGAANVR